jgi:RNA polymerase-binding transcription factor DksA
MVLEELCAAKSLTSCVGLVECDILPLARKRDLLAARAVHMRKEEGITPLSGVPHQRREDLEALRTELLRERKRIVAENRSFEDDMAALSGVVGHDVVTDSEERARASEGIRLEDALEKLTVRRLDSIDRALDAMAHGTYGSCAACRRQIETKRLQLIPDTNVCAACARAAAAAE